MQNVAKVEAKSCVCVYGGERDCAGGERDCARPCPHARSAPYTHTQDLAQANPNRKAGSGVLKRR